MATTETDEVTGEIDDSKRPLPMQSSENSANDAAERQISLHPLVDPPVSQGSDAARRTLDEEAPLCGDPREKRREGGTLERLEKQEPRDRFQLVYIIMIIHGIGILMPWNMFITAKSYFEDHKLTVNETVPDKQLADYRTNFMAYLSMASQFPNVFMNCLNLFCRCGGRPTVRIVGSIIIIIIVFVVTIVLAMVDSSDWPKGFFWLTLLSAALINSACGVYQSSMFGVVAILPMKYTNAIIFGNNMSGTFVSVLNIVVIALAPDTKSSAMYYFLTAVVVLLIAVDSFFLLPHTKFYRHYKRVMALREAEYKRSRPPSQSVGDRVKDYLNVFKQIWVLALSVWFVFFVSLSLFPQIQSDIKRRSFPMANLYWTPIFCYLSFNLFAMLGNLLTEFVHLPGPRWVWLPVLLRVLFIPLYLMFNFRPEQRSWAAPIANDYVFIVCSVLMAFSAGYLSSLCMMFAPAKVEKHQVGTAGMMMAFFLVLGILSGVNASRLLVTFV